MTPARLAKLCRDRELLTREIHLPNAFYGHSQILRRYAKWTSPRAVKVAIEHGIVFHDFFWDLDLATRMPLFLCGSSARAREFELRTRKRAVAIGPLIRYAAALLPESSAPAAGPAAGALLAFPAHSTHHVDAAFDAEAFADVLAQEGKQFGHVIVCMYWRDYLAGRSAAYERRGFEVVSAGHMYDSSFLLRLVGIIRRASLVIANEIGTCLMYAILLDRPAWLRRQEIKYDASSAVLARDGTNEFFEHARVRQCFELFRECRDDITADQRDYVDRVTGGTIVKSAAEVHALLASAEEAYRGSATVRDRVHDIVHRGMHLGRSVASMAGRRLHQRS